MSRALIYLRVSTVGQAAKGLSIPAQKERCLQYAKANHYEVNLEEDIFMDEGESARTADRPQFQILWARCRSDATVKAVIFYDVSRLARNRIDFALVKHDLAKRGIQICSATEGTDSSPSGQMLEGVLSSVAEFFSLQNGEKTKGGMAQKAKEGGFPGKAPYGYRNMQERLSGGKTRSWIEVNWEEAKWITKAFEMFSTGGFSIVTLAEELESEGFPVRKNKKDNTKVHASFLEKVLRDPFYVGTVRWAKGTIINPNGTHELFLDKKLFDKTQAILDARLGGGSRQRRHFSMIKGVAFCGECGSRIVVEEQTTTSGNVMRYSRCLKAQKGKRVLCNQRYPKEGIILEELESLIKTIELPEYFVEKLRNRIKGLFADEERLYEKARTDILNRIEDTKQKKKNLVLQLIDRKNSPSDMALYESIKADLNNDEERFNNELAKIENTIAVTVRTVETAMGLAMNCFYAYDKAEPELKALLVRTFFKRVLIKDKKIVKATLNEPLDYICYDKLKKNPIFDLAAVGSP